MPYSNSTEVWKKVILDGKEWHYEVSNLGRVRNTKRQKGHIRKVHLDQYGYLRIGIYSYAQIKMISLHVLIAVAFVGPKPPGKQVNHKDGNKLNNAPSNLEWVTTQENTRHATAMGLIVRGDRHPSSRITEAIARGIKVDLKAGLLKQIQIARKYGVTRCRVNEIKSGKCWGHVLA